MAVSVGVSSGTPAASTAIEVSSFETSPGIIRTSLPITALDVDSSTGLIYAVTDQAGSASLVAIDPSLADTGPIVPFDTVSVVAQVQLAAGFAPTDVDVSRDGRTVVVGSADEASTFERSTLRLIDSVGADSDRVVASPDRSDRFVATDGGGGVVIVDGDSVISLSETIDPANGGASVDIEPPYSWGADSESVIGVVDRYLARVTVSNPPMLVQVGSDPVAGRSLTVQGNRLLIGGGLHDFATLDLLDRLDSFTDGPTNDGTASFAVVSDAPQPLTPLWQQYDVTDVTEARTQWALPIGGEPMALNRVDDWATLPDGRVAIAEPGEGPPTYLTVTDPERLASPFGEFHPVQPARVLDTRLGVGRDGAAGKLGPSSEVSVQLSGRGGLPDDGVLAVVLNATVTGPTQSSFFSIWPTAVERPVVSNLNFAANQTIANSVTVAVGADGSVNLSNEFGSAHAILDVVGYYATETGQRGARYSLNLPRRVLDTRPAAGGDGRVGPGETITVSLDAVPNPFVPSSTEAVAVALNVTAVQPTAGGFLTVWPSQRPRPVASSLNFAAAETRANLVIVGVGEGNRSVDIYNESGSTHLLVDVFGLYVRTTTDTPRRDQQGRFLPIVPFRSFDSRVLSPYDPPGRIPENRSIIFSNSSGWTDIWNVTAVNPTADGFLSVLGFDEDRPNTNFPETSNVNFRAGETVANGVYALGRPDTEVYNPFGETHLVIDRFGYLTPKFQRPVDQAWSPR